jgi:prepilin-type N-terminal cleavage/methylation domain-containing protein
MKRDGFSLLEVILALAILAGAIAVLGEAGRQAVRNAAAARDMARAQLLCETVLSELVTGVLAPDAVEKMPFDVESEALDPDEPAWLYSIETAETDETGLISVRVTVTRDLPPAQHPVEFSLVRWMPDPNATSSSQGNQSSQQSGSGSGGSSTSGGGSGGS